jgi:hypothetical protein
MSNSRLAPLCRVTKADLLTYDLPPRHRTGDVELHLLLGGERQLRRNAFEGILRAAREWQGIDALHVASETKRFTWATLVIPARVFGQYRDLAGFFHGLAGEVGLRARTLALLNAEVEADSPFNPYRAGQASDLVGRYAIMAARQAAWAARLDEYLALDAAAGSCGRPELVRELHLGRSPLEHLVLRALMDYPCTRLHQTISLYRYQGFSFSWVPRVEMEQALSTLSERGWTERVKYLPGYSEFQAAQGPLLRKISSHDLLTLGWF